jgi:outer membrane protein TolC
VPSTPPVPPARALQADSLPTQLPPAEVLTFDAAVARALRRNPSARVAEEEIARARDLVEQTRAASLPTLSANGVYTRLDHERVLNGNVIAGADQVNASLQLVVPLVAPSRWVQWSQAKDNVEVARGSAAEVRRQLALTTARTYLSLMAQHRVVEVSVRARNNARAHYEFARQRYVGGYGTRVDEVRAAQEVATDESELQARVAELARLRETLGVLVGVDAPIDVTADVTLPAPAAPPAIDQLLHDALVLRADLRLANERLHAAEHVVRDNWTDYAPAVVGTFQPFFQDPPTLTLPRWGWQATIGLSWSLYDGGLRYGLHKERSAVAREAATNLEGEQRQARAEVRTADEALRRSAAALQAARDAAKLAGDGLALTNLAYRGGASTNIEVVDAERRARDAETAAALAEDAWRQATLDLLLASGRFPAAP